MWGQAVSLIWLIFKYSAWMVKDMCWSSVVALWAGKCTRWFQSNFRERKALHSGCITLTPSWCSTCHCKSMEFQARKQKPFLHLCSNRCLCSMVFYTKARIPGPRCTHCCRRDCANSRYNNCHVFEASAKKPWKLDIWGWFHPEPATSDPAKQPAELDIWIAFQPEPGRGDPAQQSSELEIWTQPEPGKVWLCQVVLRAWHLGRISTRASNKCSVFPAGLFLSAPYDLLTWHCPRIYQKRSLSVACGANWAQIPLNSNSKFKSTKST